ETGEVKRGMFVIGWSRQASDGLVGKAKQDGERGVQAVNRYLEKMIPGSAENLDEKLDQLRSTLESRGVRTVDNSDVQQIEEIERKEAAERELEFYKFASNEEMFEHLVQDKVQSGVAAD
ncbi:MAG TPA: hypothetical protein VEF04_07065, partial [Blastocatellia bacterium]|nr:hypothetical protein [Blastocatellia bacterium]